MAKKWIWIVLALCMLLPGCAQPQENPDENTTTEATQNQTEVTESEPRVLDDNGDGVVVWYALGDSITQGYNSYLDSVTGEGKLNLNKERCWATFLAASTGWELTNAGVGGSGFVHNGTVLDMLNARDHVDSIDFSNAELITIAYGVNDWKYNMKLGTMEDDIEQGGTFYSNMRYILEKLQKDCPDAEIVVISPLNCSRYGLEKSNWGLGYKFFNNGTLQDIYDAMKEVCDYYGLPLVDILHNEEINSDITNWLPDGVHPSLQKHMRLAEILEEELKKVLPEA